MACAADKGKERKLLRILLILATGIYALNEKTAVLFLNMQFEKTKIVIKEGFKKLLFQIDIPGLH